MKNYMMVSKEELWGLLEAFTGQEEAEQFTSDLIGYVNECYFNLLMVPRVDKESADILLLKNLLMLTLFYRDNIEIIQQLIMCLKGERVTQEQLDEHQKESQTE